LRVLFADDDAGILETTTDILTMAGFDVSTASDGRTAADAVTREHFDAIVLDVMMPGLNGVETIDEVRKVEPQARFVVITAYSDSELVEEVRKRGVSDILFKPFDAADLLARLEAMRGQLAGS
jgi:DNA-binding response OmpR family regulator